ELQPLQHDHGHAAAAAPRLHLVVRIKEERRPRPGDQPVQVTGPIERDGEGPEQRAPKERGPDGRGLLGRAVARLLHGNSLRRHYSPSDGSLITVPLPPPTGRPTTIVNGKPSKRHPRNAAPCPPGGRAYRDAHPQL